MPFYRSFFILLFSTAQWATVMAQATDSSAMDRDLPEVVISVNRVEQKRDEIPQQVMSLRKGFIERENPATVAEALQYSGQVFVQKSQQGGGSPVIRGFEASRVLLVVDDVRMNNLIYRAGHLQNIITLDPFYLERIETVFGPSSTIYGSDALGGVVHMRTRQPVFSPDDESHVSGNGLLRFTTATVERTAGARVEISERRWASITSIGLSSFGDVRMGERAGSADTVWGLRNHYVEDFDGRDSLVENSDPFVQKRSGYGQIDILQRFRARFGDRDIMDVNLQFSTSTEIPRYDRLTDATDTGLKFAEWEYGPQKRLLTALTYDHEIRSGFFKRFKSVLSYQAVEESRITREFRSSTRTNRKEDVDVFGYTVYLDREEGKHDVRAGADGQVSMVNSTAYTEDIRDGLRSPVSTRYPSGYNGMGNHALFFSHTWKVSPKIILNDGLRLTFTTLNSDFADTGFYPFPYGMISQDNVALCGNLGLVYRPSERWKLSLLGSSGFRTPNVDDLAKVFDSSPGTVIMPNPGLGPERLWSIESSVGARVGEFYFEGTAFHSWFDRAIVILPGTFNGADSIFYDGVLSAVRTSYNERRAYVQGLSGSMEAELGKRFHLVGTMTYTKGRIMDGDDNPPLDHIPPLYGRISLRYEYKSIDAECFMLFNGKKPIGEYLLNGEDNEQYALPQGIPAWSTINFRLAWKTGRIFKLQFGVDNVFDLNYRTFASGIHAPGRNFIFAARVGL